MRIVPSYPAFLRAYRSGKQVPVAAVLPLKQSAQELFGKLRSGTESVLLESARQHPATARYSILAVNPVQSFFSTGRKISIRRGQRLSVKTGDPLDSLERLLAEHPAMATLPIPFSGGAVGCIGFETARMLENLPSRTRDDLHLPEIAFLFFDGAVVADHLRKKLWVTQCAVHRGSAKAAYQAALQKITRIVRKIEQPSVPEKKTNSKKKPKRSPFSSTHRRDQFERMVLKAKKLIGQGDIYQANLSQRFSGPFRGDPWGYYRRLTDLNPSPFSSYADFGRFQLVSASPERLFRVQGRQIETRPIAGTRPRGKNARETTRRRKELLLSEKERAEHLMLVDLERNDLGRVCRYGSVRVDDLMALEQYSHVIHIVSNVTGTLKESVRFRDLLKALFPGGTISGCPKIRCLEIIDALEPVRRHFYTGALGYVSRDGRMDFNLLIRTALVKDKRVYIQAGAGIVADSDPSREYEETVHKAQALLETFSV